MPFARRKPKKCRRKGGGSKNDDSAAKKKKKELLWGTVAGTLGAGFGRVFAPGASRIRKKHCVYDLSSGSGGVPWGTHARARGNAFLRHSCGSNTPRRAACAARRITIYNVLGQGPGGLRQASGPPRPPLFSKESTILGVPRWGGLWRGFFVCLPASRALLRAAGWLSVLQGGRA